MGQSKIQNKQQFVLSTLKVEDLEGARGGKGPGQMY